MAAAAEEEPQENRRQIFGTKQQTADFPAVVDGGSKACEAAANIPFLFSMRIIYNRIV